MALLPANKRLSAPIRAMHPEVTWSTRINGEAGKNSVRSRLLRSPTPTVRLPVSSKETAPKSNNGERSGVKVRRRFRVRTRLRHSCSSMFSELFRGLDYILEPAFAEQIEWLATAQPHVWTDEKDILHPFIMVSQSP